MLFIIYVPSICWSSVTCYLFVLEAIDFMQMTGTFREYYRLVRNIPAWRGGREGECGGLHELLAAHIGLVRGGGNPKSEIRDPKEVRRPKSEEAASESSNAALSLVQAARIQHFIFLEPQTSL